MGKSDKNIHSEKLNHPNQTISSMEEPDGFCFAVKKLITIKDFTNEADVREEFVYPLLDALGYSNNSKNKIERNVSLHTPLLMVGTTKKPMNYYPDYILSFQNNRKWLIDAKNPDESVTDPVHIGQAYSYAVHKEINVPIFSLCNGEELAIYRTKDQGYNPIALFKRNELDWRWRELYEMLSAEAYQYRESVKEEKGFPTQLPKVSKLKWDKPIDRVIIPRKQASPIHSGPHPYFTKRAWNVVHEYIRHFTNEGDTVLDPFGGAGITAIEAILLNRKAIHVDINPIANYLTKGLAAPVLPHILQKEFDNLMSKFVPGIKQIYATQSPRIRFWYPKNVKLPEDSDVEYLHEYFSKHQLASMSLLLSLINDIRNKEIKSVFKLVFSATLVKCNLSFHNTGRDPKRGGGDAGFLKYYRFQIPKKRFPEQDPVKIFKEKFSAILKAKKQLSLHYFDQKEFRGRLQVLQGTATCLKSISDNSIDYVFTDPPYGSKISYLDCSTLWNAWLKLPVKKQHYDQEVISGGSFDKSDDDYIQLLQRSLNEIYRVLKPNRWFSLVFASENPRFWHAIREHCINLGFDHVNTVCQPSDRKTVKKNQNPLTVFRGEMILNFRKQKQGKMVVGISQGISSQQFILNSAELTIVANGGKASLEDIMQELIPKLWESGLLAQVSNEIDDITEILKKEFNYDKEEAIWGIREKKKIGSHIPLEYRIRFYLLSCLNRAKGQKNLLSIEEIVMEVLPFLRNGITPSNQDIITELKKIAYSPDGQHWVLNKAQQQELFY